MRNLELSCFCFDETDMKLLKHIKNKLVKSQLYDVAALLRDVEKTMITLMEEVDIARQKQGPKIDAFAFDDFIRKNYFPVYKEVDGEPTVVYGKNNDTSGRNYTLKHLFALYGLEEMKNKVSIPAEVSPSTDSTSEKSE